MKSYLSNKYIKHVYEESSKMSGLKRKLYLIAGIGGVLVKHGFQIWDYTRMIKKNNCVVMLKDGKSKLFIPNLERDAIQLSIANSKDYFEIEALNLLKQKYIRKNMRILDIGANIGNHSVFFALRCKAKKVYSFEPVKTTYEILKKNIMLNDLGGIVQTYNVGLGRRESKGEVSFFWDGNIGEAQIQEKEKGDVSIKTLDSYDIRDIDFIKIDVEGFEYNVILGSKKTLIRESPIIFIEIFKEKFDKVDALLGEYGYHMVEELGWDNYIYKKLGKEG